MRNLVPRLEPGRSETFPYPEIEVRGVSPLGPICYFDAGRASGLPPVVLIHALGTNLTHWEYIAPVLAQHTRVIGLDLPGCGHSAKPRYPYGLQEMTGAVQGLLAHLGIGSAVLFGHSFGGRVATELVLQRPELGAGLVLMNSSGFTRFSLPVRALGRLFFRPPLVAPLIQVGVDRILERIFARPSERTRRFIRQVVERRDPRYAWEFAHYACPLIDDLTSNVLHRLPGLSAPTLVIWGEKDALLSYRDVPGWVARLRSAELLSLPECGHMPNLEQPEEVSAAVLGFLQRLAAAEADEANEKQQAV